MKCKHCGSILSPKERDEILDDVANGCHPEIICDDCIDMMNEQHGPDTGSDADPGL